nr:145R [Iridovirus CN01]UPA43885.1 145R [Iridovirus CN01]
MKVNGKFFKVYMCDTISTIKDRIASKLNTIPFYLSFSPEIDVDFDNGDYKVRTVLDPILNSNSITFPSHLINFDIIGRDKAERIFLATHQFNNKPRDEIETMLKLFNGFITGNVLSIWDNRQTEFEVFKKEVQKLKDKTEKIEQSFQEFERIKPVHSTSFETTQVRFNVKISPIYFNRTISELFNILSVNKDVPYANMGKIYKVHREFVPDEEWLDLELNDVILVKVNGEKQEDMDQLKPDYRKYTNAAFTIKDEQIIATMDMNVNPKNISRDEFIKRVISIFPGLTINMVLEIVEQSTIGYVAFPRQTILTPVWADLCMNNSLFFNVISLNESIRSSKKKMNAYIHVLNTNDVINVVMKETDKPNMYEMEDEGTYYLRARIKSQTEAQAEKYRQILAKCLMIYNNDKNVILSDYREYIPNFLEEDEIKLVKRPRNLEKLDLRTIAPEIFLPTYSRKCLKRPTVITEKKAKEYRKQKKMQVMEFPMYGESTKRYYICEHKSHPYPGLRENVLENRKTYPLIPCCYIKNQDKSGSNLDHYRNQREIKTKASAVKDMFVTGKTLPPGYPGSLPSKINNFFTLIETDPSYQFVRLGSNMNRNSFLECVMLALNKNQLKTYEVEDRVDIVTAKRRELVTEACASAAKQEFYNLSLDKILSRLKNSYLNSDFIHVLEQFFDCNIFLFNEQTLVIPNYIHSHFKMKPTRHVIFVYQHETGVSIDGEKEVQTELIVKTNTPETKLLKNMETAFLPNNPIVHNVWQVYRNLNKTYNENKLMPEISIYRLNVESQIVDVYGKCRAVNMNFGGSGLTMVTEPIAPYMARRAVSIYRAPISLIKKFAIEKKVVLVHQYVNQNKTVTEIDGLMSDGNLHVTFLTNDKNPMEGIPISQQDEDRYYDIFQNTNKILDKFDENKKLSKIIYQYSLYVLSKFIHENKIENLTDSHLDKFVKNFITVKPNHTFDTKNISTIFSPSSQFLQNGKIITTSVEMSKRLAFMLRLYRDNNFNSLLNYKNQRFILDFYDEVSDFDEHPQQFIFEGREAIEGLNKSYKINNNKITNEVKPNHPDPYFFHNENISSAQNYLAQNINETIEGKTFLQTAGLLVKFWHRNGFNVYESKDIFESYENDVDNVNVFSYQSNNIITNVTNYEKYIPGLILAYKFQGDVKYTALMPL